MERNEYAKLSCFRIVWYLKQVSPKAIMCLAIRIVEDAQAANFNGSRSGSWYQVGTRFEVGSGKLKRLTNFNSQEFYFFLGMIQY